VPEPLGVIRQGARGIKTESRKAEARWGEKKFDALAIRDLRGSFFPSFNHDVKNQEHGGQTNPQAQKDFGSFAPRAFPAPGQERPQSQDG
jgi:hypothetical protein